jgi:hypothetical protein
MCENHKKYKGIKPPIANCMGCWDMWMEKNSTVSITVAQLRSILKAYTHSLMDVLNPQNTKGEDNSQRKLFNEFQSVAVLQGFKTYVAEAKFDPEVHKEVSKFLKELDDFEKNSRKRSFMIK